MNTSMHMLKALQNDCAAKTSDEHRDTDDIVAAMLLQMLHCGWETDACQKEKLLEILTRGRDLDTDQAADLLRAASFLLHFYVADGFSRLLRHSTPRFSKTQKKTVISLMEELAHMDGVPNSRQKRLIEQTMQALG